MTNITLSSHSLRLIRSSTPDKFEKLDKIGIIDGPGVDLFTIFSNYFTNINGEIKKYMGKSTKVWKIRNLTIDKDNRYIYGRIDNGESGVKSEIVNIHTSHTDYEKQVHHAELNPYFFLIFLPLDSDIGYMILQRLQNHGIHGVVRNLFNEIIRKNFKNKYKLYINNVFSKEYFETIKREWLPRELHVIKKYRRPQSADLCDDVGQTPLKKVPKTELTTVEYLLKARYGGHTQRCINRIFTAYLKNEVLAAKFFEECNVPSDYDRLKIVALEKGENLKNPRRRTVRLDDKEENLTIEKMLLPYYDISDKVTIGDDGHPEYTDIHRIANSYLDQLIGEQNEQN